MGTLRGCPESVCGWGAGDRGTGHLWGYHSRQVMRGLQPLLPPCLLAVGGGPSSGRKGRYSSISMGGLITPTSQRQVA